MSVYKERNLETWLTVRFFVRQMAPAGMGSGQASENLCELCPLKCTDMVYRIRFWYASVFYFEFPIEEMSLMRIWNE